VKETERPRRCEELHCIECGAASVNALGWRAYLVGVGDEVDENEEVVSYCPECAAQEFDPKESL
jgi:hypothetical protein